MKKPNKRGPGGEDERDKLRMENEIEKLKLSAFYGAEFRGETNLPPELEHEWLKNIARFEEQWESAGRIPVAKKLDHPEYTPEAELDDQKLEEELARLQDLMAQEGIYLETCAEVPSRELYRFITEELFEEEIDDLDIEGLNTVFIYEEFHPND